MIDLQKKTNRDGPLIPLFGLWIRHTHKTFRKHLVKRQVFNFSFLTIKHIFSQAVKVEQKTRPRRRRLNFPLTTFLLHFRAPPPQIWSDTYLHCRRRRRRSLSALLIRRHAREIKPVRTAAPAQRRLDLSSSTFSRSNRRAHCLPITRHPLKKKTWMAQNLIRRHSCLLEHVHNGEQFVLEKGG